MNTDSYELAIRNLKSFTNTSGTLVGREVDNMPDFEYLVFSYSDVIALYRPHVGWMLVPPGKVTRTGTRHINLVRKAIGK